MGFFSFPGGPAPDTKQAKTAFNSFTYAVEPFNSTTGVTNLDMASQLPSLISIVSYDSYNAETDASAGLVDKIKNGMAVQGLLKTELSYSLSASWETGKGMVATLVSKAAGGLDKIAGAAGNASTASNTGFATRKFYSGGTDLTLNLDFRLYNPVTDQAQTKVGQSLYHQLMMLNSFVLPSATGQSISTMDAMALIGTNPDGEAGKTLEADLKTASKALEDKLGVQASVNGTYGTAPSTPPDGNAENRKGLGHIVQSTKQFLANTLASGVQQLMDASVEISASPRPVYIQIGKWFVLQSAIVTSIGFTYSKAQSAQGPLWVDVSMSVSSRENLLMNGVPNESTPAALMDSVKLYGVGV